MRRTLAIALAVGVLFLGGCGRARHQPAPAHAAPTLDSAKQAVTARIDKRLAALKQFDGTIGSAAQLTAAHKDTLTKLVADQRTGLTALKTKVQGETTAAGLKADAQSMVSDYRVFLLTGPKVRLTAAIDTELAVAGKLGADADAIKQSLDGQADKLLAVQPGPDAEAIKAAVTPVRDAAKKARTDLKALRKGHK